MTPDQLLPILQNNLTQTITIHQLTQSALQQFITAATLPMHLWHTPELNLFHLLQKQNSHAQKDFDRALRTLPSTTKPSNSKTPTPEPPAPHIPSKPQQFQSIRVSIVDGKTITNPSPTAAFYLEKNIWHLASGFVRQYEFKDAIIPDEYAYVLKHKGRDYAPYDRISITYSTEVFKTLCEQEIATNAPHLLDGERVSLFQMNGQSSGFRNYKKS